MQGFAELQQVGVGPHTYGEPDRILAVEAEQGRRRIDIAAGNRRHVAQPEEAVIDAQIDGAKAVLRGELAADPHADPLRPRLDDARRRYRVLRLQAGHDRLLIEAKGRDLAGREFEIDRLVLRADEIDLAGIGHGQDFCADILDIVAQLARGQPVRR